MSGKKQVSSVKCYNAFDFLSHFVCLTYTSFLLASLYIKKVHIIYWKITDTLYALPFVKLHNVTREIFRN